MTTERILGALTTVGDTLGRFAGAIVSYVPHAFETRDRRREAEEDEVFRSISGELESYSPRQIEQELRTRLGVDRLDYETTHFGYSISRFYRRPKTLSEAEKRVNEGSKGFLSRLDGK